LARNAINAMTLKMPWKILEQAAIAGAFNPQVLADLEQANGVAATVASRVDELEDPLERGWIGEADGEGGLIFKRTLRGVTETHHLDNQLAHSTEARRLAAMATELKEAYAKYGSLRLKDQDKVITGPVALVNEVMAWGRKGIAIQRYKGLGEMNPEQLWETTLDPNVRRLLQVKVAQVDDAEQVFSTLMGDIVEPRREFIQDNALNVKNLDV
jgi:DNA gyrase subunit B